MFEFLDVRDNINSDFANEKIETWKGFPKMHT